MMKPWMILGLFLGVLVAEARVENPVLFIGEVVKNGTLLVPLATDANGKLVSGLTTFTVAATANTTTTSGTATALNSMTLTPGAGTYWTTFNTSVQSTAGGNSVTMGIYANGVLQGETQTVQFPTATLIDTGYPFFIGLHFPTVTVAAGQTIIIQWSTNGGTATCLNRRLSLLRIE